MTYEENVRRIAEVLARIESPHFFQILNNYQRAVNVDQAAVKLIDEQEEAARAMIREIYSGIKEYIITCSAIPNVADKAYTAAQYLIERGLIPTPCNHAFQYIDDVPKAVCTICGTSEEINSPSNEQK